MEILYKLGVNSTIWIHLGIFILTFMATTFLLFRPYMGALKQREERTIGNEAAAVRIIQETEHLHSKYEEKAKLINSKIQSLFAGSRADGLKAAEEMLLTARHKADDIVSRGREEAKQKLAALKIDLQKDEAQLTKDVVVRLTKSGENK